MTDIEKLKKGLQCCQVAERGDLEDCERCPYNEVSIVVQECRTAMSRDTIAAMEELENDLMVMFNRCKATAGLLTSGGACKSCTMREKCKEGR